MPHPEADNVLLTLMPRPEVLGASSGGPGCLVLRAWVPHAEVPPPKRSSVPPPRGLWCLLPEIFAASSWRSLVPSPRGLQCLLPGLQYLVPEVFGASSWRSLWCLLPEVFRCLLPDVLGASFVQRSYPEIPIRWVLCPKFLVRRVHRCLVHS